MKMIIELGISKIITEYLGMRVLGVLGAFWCLTVMNVPTLQRISSRSPLDRAYCPWAPHVRVTKLLPGSQVFVSATGEGRQPLQKTNPPLKGPCAPPSFFYYFFQDIYYSNYKRNNFKKNNDTILNNRNNRHTYNY